MRRSGSAVLLAGLMLAVEPATARPGDMGKYVVEPPDVLRLDVTGLPEEAQPVSGDFVVRPDGTVWLGTYGSVTVSGLTLGQARDAVAKHLSAHAAKTGKLAVHAEVSGSNSKFYYVIGPAKGGKQVYRFPADAGATAVGAVLQVEGLAATAATGRVRVTSRAGKVREVDWRAITQEGRLAGNHKLEAGDRVHVGSTPPE